MRGAALRGACGWLPLLTGGSRSFPVGYDVDGDDGEDDSDEEDSDEDEEDVPRVGKKSGACACTALAAPAARSGDQRRPPTRPGILTRRLARAARVSCRRGHQGAACG